MIDPTTVDIPDIPVHKTQHGKFDPMAVVWDAEKHKKLAAGTVWFDPEVQRSFRAAHAQKISKTWNIAMADPVHLSVRDDGTEVIIDGAHTAWAAMDNGVKSLPCIRHYGLTKRQEAAFHLRHQSARQADSAADKWGLKIAAGIPQYVDADKVLRKHNLVVGSHIKAAGALDFVVKNYGADALESVILTMNAWVPGGAKREDWTASSVIRSLGFLFGNYPLVATPAQLGKKLGTKVTPRYLDTQIAENSKGGGGSGSRFRVGSKMIADIWNIRRKTNLYPIGVLGVEPADEDEGEDD
ncbi:MAG TPA: hypothetical protein VFI41_04935 [Gemmatimonadales bacterium]|nr:hypothetical protein [Gemmatimonadales bacterium]